MTDALARERRDLVEVDANREVPHRIGRPLRREHLREDQLVRQQQRGLALDRRTDAIDPWVEREQRGKPGQRELAEQPVVATDRRAAIDDVDLDPRPGWHRHGVHAELARGIVDGTTELYTVTIDPQDRAAAEPHGDRHGVTRAMELARSRLLIAQRGAQRQHHQRPVASAESLGWRQAVAGVDAGRDREQDQTRQRPHRDQQPASRHPRAGRS